MKLCRVCNTRFEESLRACPSCGRRVMETASADAGSSGSGTGGSQAAAPSGSLPPAQPMEGAEGAMEEAVDIDLELGEGDVVEERPKASKKGARARSRRKSEAPRSAVPRVREPGPSVLGLDPRQVRTLVAEQPALLEKGLGIHSDEDGQPVGVDFVTPVGEIDLLARDKRGALVVVMVPEPAEFDGVVGEVVQRIGWVRKHVADGAEVRGIVVMQELPEAVGYAAAGVAGMVSFKTFRVALTFHEIKP